MIIKLKYGNTNTFLINGKLLIDTDYAGTLNLFFKAIKKNDINIKDISYVVATHYHPDHIGIVSELMKMGIKLLILDNQLDNIHFSDYIFKKDSRINYEPINEKEAVMLNVNDSRKFLKSIGIDGEIIATSSHSEDSISIVLDDGSCFVGDLEPYEYINGYEENNKLKNDWDKILKYSPKIIYYSHINEKII